MKYFKVLTHEWKKEYKEGSKTWNQAIDFSFVEIGNIINAQELAKIHDVNPSYYDNVNELVNDGMIEIIEGLNE